MNLSSMLARQLPLLVPTVLVTAALTGCKSGGTGSGGGSGDDSIVASVPGIDDKVRSTVSLTFQLLCDPDKTKLNSVASPYAVDDARTASPTVNFTKTAASKAGDWCFLKVVAKNPADAALAHFQWTSSDQQKGTLYASTAAQLTPQRTLAVTLYTTYLDADAAHFNATVTVTLPAGAANTNPTPNGATLNCKGIAQTSTSAVAAGSSQITYTFSLPSDQFASAQGCDMNVLTNAGSYTLANAVQMVNSTTTYQNVALQAAAANAVDANGLVISVQAGGTCTTYDATSHTCTSSQPTPQTPTPQPPNTPVNGATPAPNGGVQQVAPSAPVTPPPPPAGATGLWLNQQSDNTAPFPKNMFSCKSAAIINETSMQMAAGFYCWFNYDNQGYQKDWIVVHIDYIGPITSEANGLFTFNNSPTGCDTSKYNQALGVKFALSNSNTTLSLSSLAEPLFMGRWPQAPKIETLAVGCIDRNNGTVHYNEQLKTAVKNIMVY